MGTRVPPGRIATGTFLVLSFFAAYSSPSMTLSLLITLTLFALYRQTVIQPLLLPAAPRRFP